MAFEGSLSDRPFAEVLQHVGRTTETGILTLQGQDEIIGVTFLDGAVVSVDAVNQPPEDGLGVILEESGQVSREEFATLVAENQAGGGRVMDLLVERGYINRQQLLDALRRQTLRLCAEVCAWREGRYRFYRGDQVSYEQGIEPIHVDDLLGRLAVDGVAGGEEAVPPVAEEVRPTTGALSQQAVDAPAVRAEPLDPLVLSPPSAPAAPPVEMPEGESWGDGSEGLESAQPKRRPGFAFRLRWSAMVTPRLPGRLLGFAMLVGLAALVALAPQKLLVPLDTQERIRVGLGAEVQKSLYAKVDQAAKSFFLLRGAFPQDLDELIELNLLAENDTKLAANRRLAYTDAPVSYLLAIEGEPRVEGSIRTETISGNFLLDPDFSPPELVDTPPLVLLD